MNRHVVPNGFVELPDASDSDIRVPSAARPGNFRLLVTLRSQQHDFDPVALEAGVNIGLVLGKRTDQEPEMLFIPLRGAANVVHEKRRGSRKKTWGCCCFRSLSARAHGSLQPQASSGIGYGTSGTPRHTKLTRYRCSLPGLAGFTGNRCTEPEVPPISSHCRKIFFAAKLLGKV